MHKPVVQILNYQRKIDCSAFTTLFEKSIKASLQLHPQLTERYFVELQLIGAERMRRINREQRGIDRVTDVLSFPLLDFHEGTLRTAPGPFDRLDPGSASSPYHLGSILLCPAQAERQALRYGHPLEREMAFLTCHACLHLLGYDHLEPEEEALMRARQREVMRLLGLQVEDEND